MIRTLQITLAVLLFIRNGITALQRATTQSAKTVTHLGWTRAVAKIDADVENAKLRAEAARRAHEQAEGARLDAITEVSCRFPVVE